MRTTHESSTPPVISSDQLRVTKVLLDYVRVQLRLSGWPPDFNFISREKSQYAFGEKGGVKRYLLLSVCVVEQAENGAEVHYPVLAAKDEFECSDH